jgi:hypothetical protein
MDEIPSYMWGQIVTLALLAASRPSAPPKEPGSQMTACAELGGRSNSFQLSVASY